jgi:hypothetical protein
LHQKTGSTVVVVVDEYDMPILDSLHKGNEKIDEIHEFLQIFYKVFKGADEHLRFLFMTGITKFAKVSVFSTLNNLGDVTFDAKYATLCGYTQEELESCFAPSLEELAVAHKCDVPEVLAKIRVGITGFRGMGKTRCITRFRHWCFCSRNSLRICGWRPGRLCFLST